jgi:hypothetical protein
MNSKTATKEVENHLDHRSLKKRPPYQTHIASHCNKYSTTLNHDGDGDDITTITVIVLPYASTTSYG